MGSLTTKWGGEYVASQPIEVVNVQHQPSELVSVQHQSSGVVNVQYRNRVSALKL